MQLREAKQILRAALETASDEKLAEMLAWAQDGMMRFESPCACFLGSLGADKVHEGTRESCDRLHYSVKRECFFKAELAYCRIGLYTAGVPEHVRQRRIVPIIKAQMRIRELHRKDVREFTAMKEESHATA